MFLTISTERASPVRLRTFARIFRGMARQPGWAGAAHGVPALAGQTRSCTESRNIPSRVEEVTSCRLKPGLHTRQPSVANQVFGLGLAFLFLTARLGDAAPAGVIGSL